MLALIGKSGTAVSEIPVPEALCGTFRAMPCWIDTHCHLDAPEFTQAGPAAWAHMRRQALAQGVAHCVLPAVKASNFETVRAYAHGLEAGFSADPAIGADGLLAIPAPEPCQDVYALGLHPLYILQAQTQDLELLEVLLTRYQSDPRLVAVGEIGLDFFVPALCQEPLRQKQEDFYRAQLKLAKKHDLPVILHVRRSADRLLKYLREGAQDGYRWRGIAHAFNGSAVQALEFVKLGFKLGFGGAVTFERALQLRRLATELPLEAIVLETDAPDIPPQWLYTTAGQRAAGVPPGINSPAELPRIAAVVAALRGITVEALAEATTANAVAALPRLAAISASG